MNKSTNTAQSAMMKSLLAFSFLLLVSYIWLGEVFRWSHLAGFAFVLGGIGMVSWAHYRSEKIAQQQGKEYETCHATPC